MAVRMTDDSLNTTASDRDDPFDIRLPRTDSGGDANATHVAHMLGDETTFVDVLTEFVRTGSPLSEPLRSPIDDSTLDRVRLALEGLGPAKVASIEPL